MAERLAAGCMTGTSIDSLDAALVAVEGQGLAMTARFVRGVTRPLGTLAAPLRRLAEQEAMTAGEIAGLTSDFASLHTEALRALLGGDRADLVAIHGQTVFHAPPVSWQLFAPTPVARALETPVVFDLRAADLVCGGRGAPITPLADWVFFRTLAPPVAVVNLGGFCNVTLLRGPDPASIAGFDVCACNHLLDGVARTLLQAPFDEDGRHASGGRVQIGALEDLVAILATQASSRRSLGTGDETGEWISRWHARASGADLAATACEGIARTIASRLGNVRLVLLAGGGTRNLALGRAIASRCSCTVEPADAHGLPGAYREAACMAVLGVLCRDRVPITLPAVTGVGRAPVAGIWVQP